MPFANLNLQRIFNQSFLSSFSKRLTGKNNIGKSLQQNAALWYGSVSLMTILFSYTIGKGVYYLSSSSSFRKVEYNVIFAWELWIHIDEYI